MMNKTLKKILLALAFVSIAATTLFAWGFWGHRKINRMAVFTLPPQMLGFFKINIEFVTEHAVDPDKRRYAFAEEAPRHYIDLDRYGDHPFDSLPKFWQDATKKYGEDSLMKHGIVPWHVVRVLGMLTSAMKDGNIEKILHHAADLGHYVGDAHVPLHCTKNYNGQLTGQDGIHGFWESRVPELFGDKFDYFAGKAVYIKDPQEFIWNVVKESYAAKDSVLLFEAELNKQFSPDKKYVFEQRGSSTVKNYSQEYAAAYNKMLNGMIERRMLQAIRAVGSMWYTAWMNAGQPDLNNLKQFEMTADYKKQLKEEDKMWRTGKVSSAGGHED